MRLNNNAARSRVNEWLASSGRRPLADELSFIDYATELRRLIMADQGQPPFAARADAVAYVRTIAREHADC